MPKISQEKLLTLFTSGGASYPIYGEAKKMYDELRIHANGEFPDQLLSKQRPSEADEILMYRKDNYQPVTKLPISKVISSFGKIRRSQDWSIEFPKDTVPARIIEQESLEKYCTEKLPGFGSIENWSFGVLLRNNLIDANAVVAVIPIENIQENKYSLPVPIVFNSDHVLYFDDNDYAVLKSKRKVNYIGPDGVTIQGDRFFYLDEKEVLIYEQDAKGYSLVFQQANLTGKMPAWKLRGELLHQYDRMPINQSRLHAMVPFLNKAAAGDSDLDGSKVQHLYPLFWYFQNKSCGKCNGHKSIPGEKGPVECSSCGGTGKIKFSPFAHIQVDAAELGQQSNPVPPAGYIQRDTEILKLQAEFVNKNIYAALSAVNMQFLDQTPLSISGDAKNVDREELNNTVYNVAEDIIYSIEKVIYFINEWRYIGFVPNDSERMAMLPKIAVPQNFDLLPEDYLMKEVSDARTAKINPMLVATLEQQLAAKKFYNQPELANNIKLYFELDPLPGYSVDDKMSLLSNNGITEEDYIISSYMAEFIKRAINEIKGFVSMPYAKQKEIIKGFAAEKMMATDAERQVKDAQKKAVLDEMKPPKDPENQGGGSIDITGKLPLAIQQLSLAASRVKEIGNPALAAKLNAKIAELIKDIEVG